MLEAQLLQLAGDLSDDLWRGNKQPPEGPRVVYRAHLVGNGVDITLRVVVDTSTFSARGYQTDGHTTGLITAYCEGTPRCPDELNSA